ncbi:AaceriADL295Wp [[Ashbya] aceris (nom. inval.)]|nr:AaceriADL295Wp [[Ashbya] aceris (nom. inval.)]
MLSVTEHLYLIDSLKSVPPIRADGRAPEQFRPLDASIDFLPNSNGSARIITSDGSEALVSVKSKVVDHTVNSDLIVVDVDITGQREDSPTVSSMSSLLRRILAANVDMAALRLTKKYSFQLYIDVLVLCNQSYPVSLISFAIYAALKTTQLPKLVSGYDDLEVEELPLFHDHDLVKLEVEVPLLFTVAIVGDNIIVDPSAEEASVSSAGLLLTWHDGKVAAPFRSIGLNEHFCNGFQATHLLKAIELVKKHAPAVARALCNL